MLGKIDESSSSSKRKSAKIPSVDMSRVHANSGSNSDDQSPEGDNKQNSSSPEEASAKLLDSHRSASNGKGSQEVSDDQDSYQRTIDLIEEACKNRINPKQYEVLLQQVEQISLVKLAKLAKFQSERFTTTVLHVAAFYGAREVVQILLKEFGRYVDSFNMPDEGDPPQSPLTYAVRNGDVDVIADLLEISKRPVDALCAAISLHEDDSILVKIHQYHSEVIGQFLNHPVIQRSLRTLKWREGIGPLHMRHSYHNSKEYGVLIKIIQSKSDRLLREFLAAFQLPEDDTERSERLNDCWESVQQQTNDELGGLSLDEVIELRRDENDIRYLLNQLKEADTEKANALNKALNSYDIELSFYPDRKEILDWLLAQPKIKTCVNTVSRLEISHLADVLLEGRKINMLNELDLAEKTSHTKSSDEQGRVRVLRPLHLVSYYCDKEYFKILLGLLADGSVRKAAEAAEPERVDQHGNTILHLAVGSARPNNDSDKDFVAFLLSGYEGLYDKINSQNQTALSIACAQRNEALIQLMATERLIGGQSQRVSLKRQKSKQDTHQGGEAYVTALHTAAKYGNDRIVALLLDRWPKDSAEILISRGNSQLNPYQIALNQERAVMFNSVNPKDLEDPHYIEAEHRWVEVQERLLTFLHDPEHIILRESVINGQFRDAEDEIGRINDFNLKARLIAMTNQLKIDYNQLRTDVVFNNNGAVFNDADIIQINMILGLLNETQRVAQEFSRKSSTPEQLKNAKENFEKCCRHKLYSDNIIPFYTALVCAIIGCIIGGVLGFIAGYLATAGGPGGFWLALPSAKYMAEVSAFIGSLVGGAVGGVGCVKFSDIYKWERGLWAISSSMNRNIKNAVADQPLEDVALISLKA
jgi:ankyrin repeat protein